MKHATVKCDWINDSIKRINEWMTDSKWMNEWMNEWINKWMT